MPYFVICSIPTDCIAHVRLASRGRSDRLTVRQWTQRGNHSHRALFTALLCSNANTLMPAALTTSSHNIATFCVASVRRSVSPQQRRPRLRAGLWHNAAAACVHRSKHASIFLEHDGSQGAVEDWRSFQLLSWAVRVVDAKTQQCDMDEAKHVPVPYSWQACHLSTVMKVNVSR